MQKLFSRPLRTSWYWKGVAFSILILAVMLASVIVTFFHQPVAHAATTPIRSSGCGQWSIISSPSPNLDADLMGVASISTNDVWAVGSQLLTNGSSNYFQALAEHWDGTQWSVIATPNPSSSQDILSAVAAVSTNDVWAVGSYSTQVNVNKTLVEHWNGTRWSVVSSPTIQNGASLSGIAIVSANSIWAVGSSQGENASTLVEHWNGTRWSVVASSNPSTSGNSLNAVAVVSANNIWAVGNDGFPAQTLVEHWNGTQWSVVSSPSPGGKYNVLNSISAISANNIWAVGDAYSKSGFNTHTLIEHWNGTAWSVVSSPSIAKHKSSLWGISAISATDIWAVGFSSAVNPNFNAQTLIEHWNGTQWSIVSSPNPGNDPYSSLAAVAVIPGTQQLWSVGDNMVTGGGKTLTEFYC